MGSDLFPTPAKFEFVMLEVSETSNGNPTRLSGRDQSNGKRTENTE